MKKCQGMRESVISTKYLLNITIRTENTETQSDCDRPGGRLEDWIAEPATAAPNTAHMSSIGRFDSR